MKGARTEGGGVEGGEGGRGVEDLADGGAVRGRGDLELGGLAAFNGAEPSPSRRAAGPRSRVTNIIKELQNEASLVSADQQGLL